MDKVIESLKTIKEYCSSLSACNQCKIKDWCYEYVKDENPPLDWDSDKFKND